MTDTNARLIERVTGHTPGPWLVGTGGGGGATTFVYETGEDGKQKSAIAGCTLNYVERPMDEREANARLIAAAPTLISRIESLTAEVARLAGDINEARVHLSDLTGKGLGSVDSADEVLRAALGDSK